MALLLRLIVNRLHPSASNTEVIRTVRSKLKRSVQTDPVLRQQRKDAYRAALAIHQSNVVFYFTGGSQ